MPLGVSSAGRVSQGRHRAVSGRSVGDRGRWLRLGVAAGLTAFLVPIVGLVVPLVSSDPAVVAQAGATPKPGSPGGNHSKPGDNKKKKKKSDNKKSNTNGQHNDAGSRGSSEGQRATQRSGSSFSERTNANNRWSADGPNRSVNTRISSEVQPSQSEQAPSPVVQAPPDQWHQNTNPPASPTQDTAPPPTTQNTPVQQQIPPATSSSQQSIAQPPAVTAAAPESPSNPINTTTGVVIGLGAAAGAGLARRRNGASAPAAGPDVRPAPQSRAVTLTSSSSAAPAFTPSRQDVAVLRQVIANDGVPASQLDQRVNQVVNGAAQLNTQIANGTLPQVSTVPTTPVPEPGFAEGFRDSWDAGIESIQVLVGAAGPGAPGVAESWGNLAQALAQQAVNPLSSAISQVNSVFDAPNAAYFAGGASAQLAQQVPGLVFGGGEAAVARAAAAARAAEATADRVATQLPVGRRGAPLNVPPGTNAESVIMGRLYTGHSLDRLMGRGVTPTVVEDAIANGIAGPGNLPGTMTYAVPENGIKVVVNSIGEVVTVLHIGRG